ncbi:hypothetical protein Vadar_016171 [Vaccinium darrowii]|uniref:Uncharacterized protein n=1 Tax=Vaccinium darrowii TaxID=229202 RepID=A0ACB7ZBX8_9ERIC|nr:hypothetical protein Vadar_016171 [Vaccinium darrowii]
MIVFSDRALPSGESRATSGMDTVSFGGGVRSGSGAMPKVSHLGWGRWYMLRELEKATDGLADESVIGEGGDGIVYKGVLGVEMITDQQSCQDRMPKVASRAEGKQHIGPKRSGSATDAPMHLLEWYDKQDHDVEWSEAKTTEIEGEK